MNGLVVFYGIFEDVSDINNCASSAAGNQVQSELVEVLIDIGSDDNFDVEVFSVNPERAWPKGPFLQKVVNLGGSSSFVVNLPFIRRLHASIKLFWFLLSNKPDTVFSYNPGFVESLAMLFFRFIAKGRCRLVSIIQDVHIRGVGFAINLRWIGDSLAMRLARRFDLLVPVTKWVADDFNFDAEKVIIFRGGTTRQSRSLLASQVAPQSSYAVFAGALEAYNGIDKIIEKWSVINSGMVLHVFGRGPYEGAVKRSAEKNPGQIVFHGFATEDVVSRWQAGAAMNFCLRYSAGIDMRYFFPSKFFNIIAAPGLPVVNKFDGFPAELERGCWMVNDDLSDLQKACDAVQVETANQISFRRSWLLKSANWKPVLCQVIDALK